MGKRTLRAIHFELVAAVIRRRHTYHTEIGNHLHADMCRELAYYFADEFESRVEGFQREKFLKSCGLEE